MITASEITITEKDEDTLLVTVMESGGVAMRISIPKAGLPALLDQLEFALLQRGKTN